MNFQRSATTEFFNVCIYLQPRFVIFENVAAFTTDQKGANLQQALALLVTHGYQVQFGILRAAAHGVPQSRQR
jgi:site-specific DNA-cytosine methylase